MDKVLKIKKIMDKELKISAENALAAYNNTDANGRGLLEHLFGKEIFAQDIKDKVKTFDDAVAILGNDNQAVIDYYAIADKTCTEDILAFAKLRVIAEALNEGWKPKFDGGVAYVNADHGSSYTGSVFGSRLAFKTRELAEYCGKQFIDIWEKVLFA